MALIVVFGEAIESEEPTVLNSNLFPVKAKGEVLFLSVASFTKSGSVDTPVASFSPFLALDATPVSPAALPHPPAVHQGKWR